MVKDVVEPIANSAKKNLLWRSSLEPSLVCDGLAGVPVLLVLAMLEYHIVRACRDSHGREVGDLLMLAAVLCSNSISSCLSLLKEGSLEIKKS